MRRRILVIVAGNFAHRNLPDMLAILRFAILVPCVLSALAQPAEAGKEKPLFELGLVGAAG